MSKKRRSNVIELTQALVLNEQAMREGPARKVWSYHDLQHVQPLTDTQREMMHDFISGKDICGHGSAGTGKTFLAVYLALNELLRKDSAIDKIIIIRSAVATRNIGHMPGTLDEKIMHYELPYENMFYELIGRLSTYRDMKDAGKVHFSVTSFIRGLTWDRAIVIVDEAQNMNFHELNSIMTRLGEYSRIIVVGDLPQTDLRSRHEETGFDKFIQVANRISSFSVIKFTSNDIVRSEKVKNWIVACEDLGISV
jgi:phosphate starvation-inducible protein PhoH